MIKAIPLMLLILFLFGCSEQDVTAEGMISTQKAMLKALCEDERSCHQDIDHLGKSCQKNIIDGVVFEELNDMQQMQTIGEFGACIVRQMDQGFQKRFDEAIPVTETGVETTRPSSSTNNNGLLVRLMKDGIRFTDKSSQRNSDVPIKDLRDYIQNEKLAEKNSLVLLIVDKDADTGDMVEVMSAFRQAGIEKIHVAGGNR